MDRSNLELHDPRTLELLRKELGAPDLWGPAYRWTFHRGGGRIAEIVLVPGGSESDLLWISDPVRSEGRRLITARCTDASVLEQICPEVRLVAWGRPTMESTKGERPCSEWARDEPEE